MQRARGQAAGGDLVVDGRVHLADLGEASSPALRRRRSRGSWIFRSALPRSLVADGRVDVEAVDRRVAGDLRMLERGRAICDRRQSSRGSRRTGRGSCPGSRARRCLAPAGAFGRGASWSCVVCWLPPQPASRPTAARSGRTHCGAASHSRYAFKARVHGRAARPTGGRARAVRRRGNGLRPGGTDTVAAMGRPPTRASPRRPARRSRGAMSWEELFAREQARYAGRSGAPRSRAARAARERRLRRRAVAADARPLRSRPANGSSGRPHAGARAGSMRRPSSWGRPIGAIKAALIAGRRRGGGGLRPLGARARGRGRGVADRPLRRNARAARARPRSRGGPARRLAARSRRLPARRRRGARRLRGARARRLPRGGGAVLGVVREPGELPRGRAGRRHGDRAPGARGGRGIAAELSRSSSARRSRARSPPPGRGSTTIGACSRGAGGSPAPRR